MKCFMYVILAVIVGVWLRVGWVLFFPYEPLVVHAIAILDEDNTVMAGETLNYRVDYTKKMDLTATVNRWLVNSYTIPVSPYQRKVPMGKASTPNQIAIPDFASSGTYHLVIEYVYVVSTFPERTVKVMKSSGPFTIVNKNKIIQDALVEGAIESKAGIKANSKLINSLGGKRK